MYFNRIEIVSMLEALKKMSKKNTMLCLNNVAFAGGRMVISDLDTTIVKKIAYVSEEFLLPLKTLKILKKIKGSSVQIELEGDGEDRQVIIDEKFRVDITDFEQYPKFPEMEWVDEKEWFLNFKQLELLAKSTKFCMKGVSAGKFKNTFFKDGSFYTTDGKIIWKMKIDDNTKDLSFAMDLNKLKDFMKLVDKNSVYSLYLKDRRFIIKDSYTDVLFAFSLYEDESMPDMEKVLKRSVDFEQEMNREKLVERLNQALICADEEYYAVTFRDGKMFSRNKSEGLAFETESYFNDDLEARMNINYFLSIINFLDKERTYIDIKFNNKSTVTVQDKYQTLLSMQLRHR